MNYSRKRNGLKIASLNIVSLRKYKDELGIILHDNEIDVIGLNETRLDAKIANRDLLIEGYKIFRNDRNVHGGGVAIYVKDSIEVNQVEQQMDNLEIISFEIKPKIAKSFFLVSWYRPPTANVDDVTFENLKVVLTTLDRGDKEIILIGDTSCDLMNDRNANTKRLKQVYSEFQMEQLVKTYTRVATITSDDGTKRISKSLIDHFSTSNARYILKTGVLETGMVDHYLIYGIRKINAWRKKNPVISPKIVESRNMKKYDKSLFEEDLKQIDWKTILDTCTHDPSGMASTFQEIFNSVLDAHAPIKKRRVKKEFAPWLTPNIRKAMETRDRLKKIATRIPEMWSSYTKQRNRVTKLIRNSIQDQYKEIIEGSKGNPKKMWKAINRVLNKDKQSTVLSNINKDWKVLTKDSDMLEALN